MTLDEEATRKHENAQNKFDEAVNSEGGYSSNLVFDLRTIGVSSEDCKKMRKQMLDDVFFMRGLALLGQITVIYAKPNAGKTLLTIWMLLEAVRDEVIKGENVIYINADDTQKGIIEKTEIFEPYGMNLSIPGYEGFYPNNLVKYLEFHIETNTAKGIVLILDTAKKFIDLMDKQVQVAFVTKLRAFTVAGGSVIMLSHCNKHRDNDGKLVAGGTSDISDDVDCTYFLDEVPAPEPDFKQVVFENVKSRGANEQILAFTHLEKGKYTDYRDLLLSVRRLSSEDSDAACNAVLDAEYEEVHADAINSIIEAIESGYSAKSQLVLQVTKESGLSRREVIKALNMFEGKKWRYSLGFKGSKNYVLLR